MTNQPVAEISAQDALALLDEAWAYYTPSEQVVAEEAQPEEDGVIAYYEAA